MLSPGKNMPETLSLEHENGIIDLPDTSLIVGIDETGNETYSDKNHPVFGIGGCAVMAKDYFSILEDPWHYMKESYFGGVDQPLHASELKKPTTEQLSALNYFFSNFPFFRFAVMSAETFSNKTEETTFHLICHSVLQRIAEISKWVQPTEIVIIAENSGRTEKHLLKHLNAYRIGHDEIEMKPRVILASKDVKASCVEVADFVIHPAGAQVRNRLRGFKDMRNPIRKDFFSVFHNVDRKLVYYTELLSAKSKTA